MNGLLRRIFDTSRYSSRGDIEQARLIYGFTTITMLMFIGFFAVVPFGSLHATLLQLVPSSPVILVAFASVIGFGIATLVLTRIGRIDIAAIGPIVMWYLSGVSLGFLQNFALNTAGASLLVLIINAGLFLRVRGLLITAGIALATLLVGALSFNGSIQDVTIPLETYIPNTLALGGTLIGVTLLIYLFLRSVRLDQNDSESSC